MGVGLPAGLPHNPSMSVHVAPALENRTNGKNARASTLAKGRIKRVERCHQRAAICPVPAASALPG